MWPPRMTWSLRRWSLCDRLQFRDEICFTIAGITTGIATRNKMYSYSVMLDTFKTILSEIQTCFIYLFFRQSTVCWYKHNKDDEKKIRAIEQFYSFFITENSLI